MGVEVDGRRRILVVLVNQLVEHFLRLVGLPHFEVTVALLEVEFGLLVARQMLFPHLVEVLDGLAVAVHAVLVAAHFEVRRARARTFGIVVDELADAVFGVVVEQLKGAQSGVIFGVGLNVGRHCAVVAHHALKELLSLRIVLLVKQIDAYAVVVVLVGVDERLLCRST